MTEKLPAVLGEIADLVGEVAALIIAAHRGGTRVYIPASVGDAHWLVALVGFDKAQVICKHFSIDSKRGQRIDIPLYTGGSYRQFIRAIAERIHQHEQDDDASSSTIARKLGVAQRTVHRHRARHRGSRKSAKQGQLL